MLEVVKGGDADEHFSALFEKGENILKGVTAITGALEAGSFEIFVVPVVNMLQAHRPSEAEYVLAVFIYSY